MAMNNPQYEIFEPMDQESLNAINYAMGVKELPPLPTVQPEYETVEQDYTDYNENNEIDYNSLVPVDENGFEINDKGINWDSLEPYDEETTKTKELGIWDEAKVKKDLGNLTQYRADIAHQVWGGNMSVEEAKNAVQNRHTEILNKYGITDTPEFSFAKFRNDPLKTVLGETAQMLPFYGEGLKKGAAYSLATVPIAVGKNAAIGAAAGGTTGSVVPVAGNAVGAGVGGTGGVVLGVIEGINNGMLLGTFHTSIDVEGMNLYLDLREKGIDDKTAKIAGLSGGILNGALEVASFGIITAPIKGAAKKAAAKMLWDGIKKSPAAQKMFKGAVTYVTKEYFKRIGAECTTEMLQDVVSNTMTLLAAQADSVDSAKPTAEDWKDIVTKTGPQTAAAMLLMGLVSTPFDVHNAKVGSVKNTGGEIGTKTEIEQNIKDVSEGKTINNGDLLLMGGIEYDSVAEGQSAINELESELDLSNKHIQNMQKEVDILNKKKNLSEQEQSRLSELKSEIKYENDYQNLLKEEIVKTSSQISNKENQKANREARKEELKNKVMNKEKLTSEEKQELAEISIAEFEEKEKADINEKSLKSREKEITKNIRDLDNDIEKAQLKEDKAREKRNKIEERQDKLNEEIAALEDQNNELEIALKNTDIEEERVEIQTTISKNKETLKALRNNVKDLEKQRLALNDEVENAIKESDILAEKRAALDEERAGITEGIIDENGKIDMTVKQYKNQRLSALKRTMKAISNALKTGARLTRREIRDVQNTAISLIKNSTMLAKDKAKFLTTLRDINSQEKLQKALPGLINKISELEENANKKTALSYIEKLLKRAKPKKGGKTPVGKFTADIQKVLDDIKEATGLSTEQAHVEIEKIFDKAKDRELTDTEIDKIRMLYNFSGLKDKSSRELLPLIRMLKMLIMDGKIAAELKAENKRQHREQILSEAQKSIEGDKGPVEIDRKKPGFKKVFKQYIRTLGHTSDSWAGLMHILSQNDKTHSLEKMLDVFPAKMKKIASVMEWTQKVNQSIKDIYGLKNDKQLLKKCNDDSVITDIGKYANQNGETVTLQMSRAEARKLYMEMKDPTLADSFREGNGYTFTGDVDSKIDKSTQQLLEEYLTPEDKNFVDWQLKFYQEYGKHTNLFYREKYGMDMPSNEFYSPIKRDSKDIPDGYDWKNEVMFRLSMKPTSYNARTNVKTAIAPQNDILTLADHLSQNEHYIAMDGVVTDMDTIFKNKDIRDIITNKYGESILNVIDAFINDIKRDGVEAARAELKGFNRLRSNITASYLGIKAQIALKQLTAIGVFAMDIPPSDFALGIADFFKNPVTAVDTLGKSYFLKDRADSLSIEMRDIVRSNQFNMFAKMDGIKKHMFWFTQFGDKWSIMIGGWAVYKSVLNKTGSEKLALEAFERTTDKYQQSGHIDQLSAWQRSNNPLQKSIVMFTSDQMKQARAEIHAIRDAIISGKKEDIMYAAKTVAIMHIILPNIVQLITNGFEWDEDDQLRATILGPFNVYPIVGDILDTALWGAMRLSGKNINSFGDLDLTILRPFAELKQAFKKIKPDKIKAEDVWAALIHITKETVGPLIGLNLKTPIDLIEKTPKYINEGDIKKTAKLYGGWSPYIIEQKGSDKKSDNDEEDEDYDDDSDYEEDKE